MTARIISILIGYIFGCFLTAEAVAKKFAGKSASELGESGNPGMANIMASLGFGPGIITLAGDLLKVVIAALISLLLFRHTGRIIMLYAALGCTLGHDFPFWKGFRGGKGVATTSVGIVLYSVPWGLLSNIAGMVAVFVTKYLCIGGPVIPLVFTVLMMIRGDGEAAVLGAVLTLLSLRAHYPSIRGIKSGSTGKTDVMTAIRRKLSSR